MSQPNALKIASLTFGSPFVLAPLAGYTDLAFRLLCRRFGAGYTVSEMISCHGLVYRQKNTIRMLQSLEEERPVSFQLFGSDPGIMIEAAKILATFRPDMIDINMGCPVRKVTKKGAGAALMKTPDLARQIVSGITKNVSIPVTVKIRSGSDKNHLNGVEFALMLEECGAAAVTVHARTWAQAFSGTIDASIIREVKEAVSIPVVGNGDILSIADGYRLMESTGCDGVMIGRGALGNPWVFSEKGRPSSIAGITEGALQHLLLIKQLLQAERLLGYVKNQMSRYYRGLPGCSKIRQQIFSMPTLERLEELLQSFTHV